MKRYDFIFAGGGLAGLSLACHLAQSPLRDRRMLILDRDAKTRNDRTWAFWTAGPVPFDGIAQRAWRRIRFAAGDQDVAIDLGPYRYRLIRGLDFYRGARAQLAALGGVEFVQATIAQVEDGEQAAVVTAGGARDKGRWVFDSRFEGRTWRPQGSAGRPAVGRGQHLSQYFQGWQIETAEEAFDPETATLLDFRTPQRGTTRFFYVLPFSRRSALVEYVTLAPDCGETALRRYLAETLAIHDYRIVAREGGANPMSDGPFPRQAGRRVMNIGTRGGRLKPSTGYAFVRIQRDSAAIVRSLVAHGHPFHVLPAARRYHLYDALLLEVMQRHGEQVGEIFAALFQNNPIERVLRFLDEEASLVEDARLIASLPPRLFLEAIWRGALGSLTAPRAMPGSGGYEATS